MHRDLPPPAHLHYGICRRCFGTGEVESATRAGARVSCALCLGAGALA